MLALVGLGVMSVPRMAAAAFLVLVQKVWPPRPMVDVAVALAIIALGLVVLVDPSAVPAVVLSA